MSSGHLCFVYRKKSNKSPRSESALVREENERKNRQRISLKIASAIEVKRNYKVSNQKFTFQLHCTHLYIRYDSDIRSLLKCCACFVAERWVPLESKCNDDAIENSCFHIHSIAIVKHRARIPCTFVAVV